MEIKTKTFSSLNYLNDDRGVYSSSLFSQLHLNPPNTQKNVLLVYTAVCKYKRLPYTKHYRVDFVTLF